VSKQTWRYLAVTLFSYFGDMLAVMSIPLLLLRQRGDLVSASYFTLIAIAAALAAARPSALLLKRVHPLKLIFFSDLLGSLLLLVLAHQSSSATSSPAYFLFLCFLAALAMNFPMFAKNQLLYQYFIEARDVSAVTSLQGKLIGFVFVLSLLSVGAIFDSLGFRFVMLFDAATFLPLLAVCWSHRSARPLGYPEGPAESLARGDLSDQQRRQVLTYYFFNGAVYFFFTLRSHLLVTILTVFYPAVSLPVLCLAVASGAAASLVLHRLSTQGPRLSPVALAMAIAAETLLLGFLIARSHSWLALGVIGLLITEIGALALRLQRESQLAISAFYAKSRMATISIVSGSVASSGLIYLMMQALTYIGPLATFGGLAVLLAGASALLLRPRTATAIAAAALLLFGLARPSLAAENAFEYKTVMLDRPRLIPTVGANTMSEDERFISNNIYCGLFQVDITGGVVPELAASWSIENDGKLYRFKIKKGILDAEGRPIGAHYVYDSIRESLRSSVSNTDWKTPTSDLRGYLEIVGFDTCSTKSCDLPGLEMSGDEIVVRLKRRWPNFLELLAHNSMPIFRLKTTAAGKVPVSCGPYKVDSDTPSNLRLVKNANSSSSDPLAPTAFSIDFKGPDEAVKGFCSGRYNDLIFLIPTRDQLRKGGCADSDFLWREVDSAGYWAINLGSQKMLQEPRLFSRLSSSLDASEFRRLWAIDAKAQNSTIPLTFGHSAAADGDAAAPRPETQSDASPFPRPITIRYIDGTPNSDKLRTAVDRWMKRSGVPYQLIATPFTEFTKDLFRGSSDVYIYGEMATSKLANFLAPLYQMNAKHYTGAALKRLDSIWNQYLTDESPEALASLDRLFLDSRRFAPLFVMRRPLIFRRGFYLRRYSELGLATLPIQEFRQGQP
jgi:hypothetical protein